VDSPQSNVCQIKHHTCRFNLLQTPCVAIFTVQCPLSIGNTLKSLPRVVYLSPDCRDYSFLRCFSGLKHHYWPWQRWVQTLSRNSNSADSGKNHFCCSFWLIWALPCLNWRLIARTSLIKRWAAGSCCSSGWCAHQAVSSLALSTCDCGFGHCVGACCW